MVQQQSCTTRKKNCRETTNPGTLLFPCLNPQHSGSAKSTQFQSSFVKSNRFLWNPNKYEMFRSVLKHRYKAPEVLKEVFFFFFSNVHK